MNTAFRKSAAVIVLLVSACKVGPDYETPGMPDESGWQESALNEKVDAHQMPTAEWWKALQDTTLDRVMAETAAHNHDIRIARAGIDEARALRRSASSALYPAIGADASATREGFSASGNSNPNSMGERDQFTAGLDASWELDLFGGTRREAEAAEARAEASEAQYRDVMLSVLAETARNYFEVRGAQKRIALAQHNIELLKDVETLVQSQLEHGAASEFDAARARGEREIVVSTLPNLEAEMTAGIYRLSVLTGKPPEHLLKTLVESAPLPMPPDAVPVGIRSEVLRRRPDIRRAERELAASTADIGAATALMFPKFSLTGGIGTSARYFSDWFTAGSFTHILGGAMSVPLFQGGAVEAAIDASDARQVQALAMYEKTILTALEDVDASLTRYGKEWQTYDALKAAESARADAARIAQARYDSGSENFLAVIDAQRSLLEVQDAVVQSEIRILAKLTQLYKSLGGGWETPPPTEEESAPDIQTLT